MSDNDDLIIEWRDPPEPELSRVERLARLLDSHPGEWAQIVKDGPAMTIFPVWWASLTDHPRYEVCSVIEGGKRSVYARCLVPKGGKPD